MFKFQFLKSRSKQVVFEHVRRFAIEISFAENYYLLGVQLSFRCLSTDSSCSKCWSILTYPKRHEPSLDIW